YLSAKYKRIAARRGPIHAIVALEHTMIIAAHNMLTNGDFYRDLGADYYTVRQPPDQGPSNQPTRIPRLPSHSRTTHPIRLTPHPAGSPVVVTQFLCRSQPTNPKHLSDTSSHAAPPSPPRCRGR